MYQYSTVSHNKDCGTIKQSKLPYFYGKKMKKQCPYCHIEFEPKRYNQVYCSKRCRATYHNEIARELRHQTKAYTKGLFNNHKILKTLFRSKSEKSVYSKDYLLGAGFNFSLVTHTLNDDNRTSYNFCFDYALAEINKSTYKIINYVHKP